MSGHVIVDKGRMRISGGTVGNISGTVSTLQLDGTKYFSVEGTIASGVANTSISYGSVSNCYSLMVSNDNSVVGEDITIRLNSSAGNEITVKATEALSIDDFLSTSIYMSNTSGTVVSYRVSGLGV